MAASRESWVAAGLQALVEGGVEAVAVEPIAKTLGVTKASFYWHFESRGRGGEVTTRAQRDAYTRHVIDTLVPDGRD